MTLFGTIFMTIFVAAMLFALFYDPPKQKQKEDE